MQVLVATLYNKQVAVLHSGVEVHALVAQFLLQVLYEYVGILRFQTTAGMVAQEVAVQGYEVATQGKVVVGQFHAYACRLQGATALIDNMLVVTEDAAVCHLATGVESVGHGTEQAASSHACQSVGIGGVGMLKQGFSTQCFIVPVGHAVAKYDDMFHFKRKSENGKRKCQIGKRKSENGKLE